MKRRSRPGSLAALVAGLALLAGCDDGEFDLYDPVCTTELVYGLQMEVRDDVTGAPAAQGAEAEVRDGDYVEQAENPGFNDPQALHLLAAPERTGTYSVTVSKVGYESWDTAGLVVTANECHVNPVLLQVRLTPVS